MNLLEVQTEALNLLGYTNQDGVSADDISANRLLSIGNAVLNDLKDKDDEYKELLTVQQQIPLSEKIIRECFVYGVAMWLAMQNFDGDTQAIMSSLYTQKKSLLNKQSVIKDVWGGE